MPGTIYQNNPFQINVLATDPDNYPPGIPLTYFWTQTAGPATATFSNVFALQPNITCPIPGTYTFQITVSDSITPTTASISVTVAGFYTGNQNFTAVCPSGEVGASVTQSATYTSVISQADANSKALAAATTAATASLVCSSTPATWTLSVAPSLLSTESLTYNLFILDGGIAANPQHATLLHSYPINGSPYHAGDTIDYTSVVNVYGSEETFLWQCAYSRTIHVAGSGSGNVTVTRVLPLNDSVLQVDPSYTLVGKAYARECIVSPSGPYSATNVVTNQNAFIGNATYIDAPNPQVTYLALQDAFTSPALNRLWIYNWDQRVGVNLAAAQGQSGYNPTTYDYLKVSWLSAGTLSAPVTETTLYEQPYSVALYGANMLDSDVNYLSLDAAVAALPAGAGTLIVRRGTYDTVGLVVNYGPDSVLLRAAGIITGSITIGNLSGNANIPENIGGAATYNSGAVGSLIVSSGAFGIRNYNWRASSNSTYNALVVYQLIGSPGNFSGISAQWSFNPQTPNSPTGFFEIPLPTNANGISFAVYAAQQTGTNTYTLIADSFPMGTTYGSNWIDAHNISQTAPFTVTSLPAGTISGLPSATNGVFTVTDSTRQVILERAASYG